MADDGDDGDSYDEEWRGNAGCGRGDDFTEERLTQMKRNDPAVTALNAKFWGSARQDEQGRDWFHAGRVDWASEENFNAIAKNTHLKQIYFSGSFGLQGDTRREVELQYGNVEAFYRALAASRSIRTISVDNSTIIALEDVFENLAPCLERNSNLRSLQFDTDTMDSEDVADLLSACSRFNESNLRSFGITFMQGGMDDASAARLTDIIGSWNNLKVLSISFVNDNPDGGEWCAALGRLLRKPGSRLEYLCLLQNDFDGQDMSHIANGLARNQSVTGVSFGECNTTQDGWVALSRCLSNSSLEDLGLHKCNIGEEALLSLGNGGAKLRQIDVSELTLDIMDDESDSEDEDFDAFGRPPSNITGAAWRRFFDVLRGSWHALEEIDVSGNTIRDPDVPFLVNALANRPKLKSLRMSNLMPYRTTFSSSNWMSIVNFLSYSCSNLEELAILGNGFDDGRRWAVSSGLDDEVATEFANALIGNTKMKRLHFMNKYPNGRVSLSPAAGAAFSNVLCNKSDVESILGSNHSLQEISWYWELDDGDNIPSDLRSYLELNKNENKAEVARRKILLHFFAEGESNIGEFESIGTKALPFAMAWMGRDHHGLSVLFQFAKATPSLFEQAPTGLKRKHNEVGGS